MTCVSGFWPVPNKYGDYAAWFETSLRINAPYVFFLDKETIPLIQKYRRELPTFYVECSLRDFVTFKYKNKMKTHPVHCPSAELNLIWNEKIFLMRRAAELNPFSSEFFCWVDAGICVYRDRAPPAAPFPSLALPKDKFIYSSSNPYDEAAVRKDRYYHHVSGTAFILHKTMIARFAALYQTYLEELLDHPNLWTDQVVLTHIYKDNKHLFQQIASGYGAIFPALFEKNLM